MMQKVIFRLKTYTVVNKIWRKDKDANCFFPNYPENKKWSVTLSLGHLVNGKTGHLLHLFQVGQHALLTHHHLRTDYTDKKENQIFLRAP
jgi:hypothetical protein